MGWRSLQGWPGICNMCVSRGRGGLARLNRVPPEKVCADTVRLERVRKKCSNHFETCYHGKAAHADWKSAIQQTGGLRYEEWAPEHSDTL